MPPRKKKPAAGSAGIAATETTGKKQPADVAELAAQVEQDGGVVLASYCEPLAGKWVLFCALPLDKVEPTPYQRELSETHADRLATVIPKVGRYLDPIVATRHDKGYWTPNGMHRLVAMKRLGAQAITALLVPEPEVALRILALNTEKAHNLKDKSLEVMRMARGLAADSAMAKRPESDWAFEFEEPSYITVGLCYEERPRFSGGAYMSILKRTIEWADKPIAKALVDRKEQATRLLELDDAVAEVVARLKAAGFQSAYLKPFVVARLNPLRFAATTKSGAKVGAKAPRADFDGTIEKMLAAAKKFDVAKIKPTDIAASGGAPAEE